MSSVQAHHGLRREGVISCLQASDSDDFVLDVELSEVCPTSGRKPVPTAFGFVSPHTASKIELDEDLDANPVERLQNVCATEQSMSIICAPWVKRHLPVDSLHPLKRKGNKQKRSNRIKIEKNTESSCGPLKFRDVCVALTIPSSLGLDILQ